MEHFTSPDAFCSDQTDVNDKYFIQRNISNDNDVLRDSLDISEEDGLQQTENGNSKCGNLESNRIVNENYSNFELNNNEETRETRSLNENKRSKQSLKLPQKDIIELNRSSVIKGRPKRSYSKIHQQRLSESQKMTNVDGKNGPSTVKVLNKVRNTSKSQVGDIGNTESPDIFNQKYSKAKNEFIQYLDEKPKENTFLDLNELNNKIMIERSELANMNHLGQGNCYKSSNVNTQSAANMTSMSSNDYTSTSVNNESFYTNKANSYNSLPPIPEVLNSVHSAPAEFELYKSAALHFEQPNRPNSLCEFNNSNNIETFFNKTGVETTGYGSIHTKQYTYEPYTLNDYKRIKQSSISSGGLGHDTNSEEYKEKVKKVLRQKDYAAVLREKHRSHKMQWQKKPVIPSKEKSAKIQEANNRRIKALQYAKAVPKPTMSKTKMAPVKTSTENNNHIKPNTLLEMLRQRHEKERREIDAVRKDLETKLKPK